MKKSILLILFCLFLLLSACGKTELTAPFAENVKWDMGETEMKTALGEPTETYLSVYGGDCFTYPCTYLDRDGTLKIMYDEKGKLASVAWAYVTWDSEDLKELTASITDAETKLHGNTSVDPNGRGTQGSVWYTDGGDILTASIAVDGQYGFQYSYIDKAHSGRG
ncbi:MAG: hypothetical protein Q4E35_04915 [Eubacteriales bacterium]|nr:hypothetical protein [Eubacteriales bacterium]